MTTLKLMEMTLRKLDRPTDSDTVALYRERLTGYLNEAIMDLKQAAGRLIRNSTDSGSLILADARLQTKGYGKQFLRAMPTHDVRTMTIAEIAAELKERNNRN